MGCVSRVVKMHYWQPYRLAPLKISWPPLASPLKKAGAATVYVRLQRRPNRNHLQQQHGSQPKTSSAMIFSVHDTSIEVATRTRSAYLGLCYVYADSLLCCLYVCMSDAHSWI